MSVANNEDQKPFDSAAWMRRLLTLNPWVEANSLRVPGPEDVDKVRGHSTGELFLAARKMANWSRWRAGPEEWNRWADGMLALGAELKAQGLWRTSWRHPFFEFPDREIFHHGSDDPEAAAFIALAEADFIGVDFSNDANFAGLRFPDLANFLDARFAAAAWFDGALIAECAMFERAHFAGSASFDGVELPGEARFIGARFGGETVFARAHVGDHAFFERTTFAERAVFAGARFDGPSFFGEAQFGGAADFSGAHFGDRADLFGARFDGSLDFSGATFLTGLSASPELLDQLKLTVRPTSEA